MKTNDLKALKEMSKELIRKYPGRLSVDGAGILYYKNGNPAPLYEVLRDIEAAREQLELMDQTIQSLEGRKAPGKKT